MPRRCAGALLTCLLVDGSSSLQPCAPRMAAQGLPAVCQRPSTSVRSLSPLMAAQGLHVGRKLLLKFGAARTAEADKEEALTLLFKDEDEREAALDAALAVIDGCDSRLASRRWPIRLPSRRATIGCFQRLLARLEQEEPGSGGRMQDAATRRRRFLLVLLRQCKGSRGVYALEGEARRRQARTSSIEEMLARTPEGLETPKYEVVASRPAWEVRTYDEFCVCTTASARPVEGGEGKVKLQQPSLPNAGGYDVAAPGLEPMTSTHASPALASPLAHKSQGCSGLGSRHWATSYLPPPFLLTFSPAYLLTRLPTYPLTCLLRFQALAGYIFGRNQEEQKMAMTTPVLQIPQSSGEMSMSFVMPSRYWQAVDEAPTPVDGAGVVVTGKGGGMLDQSATLGALWFGGFAGKQEVAKQKAALLGLVQEDEEWEVAPEAGEPILMQYNDPFTYSPTAD